MATREEVRKWFDGLDKDEQLTVELAEAVARKTKALLVKGKLVKEADSDGQVFDTLKMRH